MMPGDPTLLLSITILPAAEWVGEGEGLRYRARLR